MGLAVAAPVAVGLFLILSSSNTEPDVTARGRRTPPARLADTPTANPVEAEPSSTPVETGRATIPSPAEPVPTASPPPANVAQPESVVVLPSAPIEGRIGSVGVWTGSEMIVWGGSQTRPTGGEDLIVRDSLRPGPAGGEDVIVTVTVDGAEEPLADGAAYNPATNTWRKLSPAPIGGRSYASAAWTGTELV